MRVAVASDHAGLPLKQPILAWLAEHGHQGVDMGVASSEPVDYPDVIAPAAIAVARGDCDLGIVLGGSGTGEQIVANKVSGVRCVQATDPVVARLAREHNDANVLSMGARIVGVAVALGCVEAFLAAVFQGGRHARRIEKIGALERDERSRPRRRRARSRAPVRAAEASLESRSFSAPERSEPVERRRPRAP